MMHTALPKTFEELRDAIVQIKQDTLELLCEDLEELTPFRQGMYRGSIMGYDEILTVIRNAIKYGDAE